MVKFTQRDLAIVAGLAGAADFLTEGRFSAPVARALKRTFRRAAPAAARAAPRLAVTALGVGKQIAVRHPYLTAGAVAYYTYKNRDEIADLVEQGYEIVQPAVASVAQPVQRGISEVIQTTQPGRAELMEGIGGRRLPIPAIFKPKRRKTPFNKAVGAGMLAVKKSTSYGKKGVIKPVKKAFALVTKLASAKKKKKKAPKSGIRRKIWTAMKGLR